MIGDYANAGDRFDRFLTVPNDRFHPPGALVGSAPQA